MQAYLGNPQLKTDFLAQITQHEQQDALIKGTYGKINGSFKGCAIGCALHSLNVLQGKVGDASTEHTGDHARYESELGLPTWFAYLEDTIFECLPDDVARTWPRRLAEAIPVGAVVDDVVFAKILRWTLADETFGVRYVTDNAEIQKYIDGAIAGFDAEIATGAAATAEQREAAASAAWATRAACDAWDARAAWAARDARDARVAWDARDARVAWDARVARVARVAWDAWAAWDARNSSRASTKADAFYPALSEFVLTTVRGLAPRDHLEAPVS